MKTMNGKIYFSIPKTTNPKIKPTLRIALILRTLSINSCPYTIVIITISMNFLQITGIEFRSETDVRLFGF